MDKRLIESSSGHFYQIGESEFPSSTTILKKAFPLEFGLKMFFQKNTKEEADFLLEEAGKSGTKVHHTIDLLLQGADIKSSGLSEEDLINTGLCDDQLLRYLKKPFNEKEDKCLRGFLNWSAKFKPEVKSTELIVYSKKHKYAGTLDFLGTIEIKGKRIPVIIDWKTSKSIYREYHLQVASYWGTMRGKKSITPLIVQFGVNKCGYRMVEVKDPEYNLKQFVNIKKTFDFLYPNYRPYNYEFLANYKL